MKCKLIRRFYTFMAYFLEYFCFLLGNNCVYLRIYIIYSLKLSLSDSISSAQPTFRFSAPLWLSGLSCCLDSCSLMFLQYFSMKKPTLLPVIFSLRSGELAARVILQEAGFPFLPSSHKMFRCRWGLRRGKLSRTQKPADVPVPDSAPCRPGSESIGRGHWNRCLLH